MAQRGNPKSAAAPLPHCRIGPFGRSQTPQNGVCAVPPTTQQGGIRLGEFFSPPRQAHGDKEIWIEKKRTREFRHRDRIRYGSDDGDGKDADPAARDGPRCLLLKGQLPIRSAWPTGPCHSDA